MEQTTEQRLDAVEKKLDEIYAVVLKTRKSQKTAAIIRALYWVFIILLGFGAFYFVQPYFSQLKDAYGLGSISGNSSSDSGNFQEFLNQLNSSQSQQ